MDYITIILLTIGLGALVALAYMAGYELGVSAGTDNERALANRRINGLLADLNKAKPRARKRRASK